MATDAKRILAEFRARWPRRREIGGWRIADLHRDIQLLCLPTLHGVRELWYQVETVCKVLRRLRGRALLCDEVGLGKTVEAGMIIKEDLLRGSYHLQWRRAERALSFVWNPLLHALEPMACDDCGRGDREMTIDERLRVRCPACAGEESRRRRSASGAHEQSSIR